MQTTRRSHAHTIPFLFQATLNTQCRWEYAVPKMAAYRKLILIGFMASGKSAVATALAPQLGLRLIQIDDEIVSRSGLPSIPAIFAEKGEPYFRELEATVAASLRDSQGVIISTGGGIITREENMTNLKYNGGLVIYLQTSFETIASRAEDLSSRPLFANKKNALELFHHRLPIYERHADIIIDTDGRSVEQVCSAILTQLQ
ncbi:MAG: hypothetical protein RL518_821 [Pseudomonadota bacterium]